MGAVGPDVELAPQSQTQVALVSFLRERRDEIYARWRRALLDCSAAARLDRDAFEGHLRQNLDNTIDAVEAIAAHDWAHVPAGGFRHHALSRLAEGIDLNELVVELFLLRHVLLEFVSKHRQTSQPFAEAGILSWAVDNGIRESIQEFARARQRTLDALDRLATIALQSRSLDALLDGLLRLILEAAPQVDTVALLLLEGDHLRLRAAAGLEADVERDFTLKLGEGFAGRVAQARTPLHSSSRDLHPFVAKGALRERGVKGLYGVPLIADGNMIGVMRMGSVSVDEFPQGDQVFLRTIADRASAAILQEQLRDRLARDAERLADALATLDSTYANAPIGLAHIDPNLRYVRVNQALARMIGTSADAFIGRGASDIVNLTNDASQQREERLRHLLETGEPWLDVPVSGEARAAPGQLRFWRISYYPIRAGGRTAGIGVVVRDVTEEERAEELRRHIVGIVGHDLRAPLSAITLSTDVLLKGKDVNERQARYLERIRTGANRMARMISDLLDYTRARVGQPLRLTLEAADIGEICKRATDEAVAGNPGRTFTCEGSGASIGEWDPDRLAQVLSNLLANAASYSPPDTPVQVTWRGTDDSVQIEVKNEGAAIAPDLLPRIFEPFGRPQGSSSRHGLGLGLFITHEIVTAHGGTIDVKSTEGCTVFRVELPRATIDDEANHGAPPT